MWVRLNCVNVLLYHLFYCSHHHVYIWITGVLIDAMHTHTILLHESQYIIYSPYLPVTKCVGGFVSVYLVYIFGSVWSAPKIFEKLLGKGFMHSQIIGKNENKISECKKQTTTKNCADWNVNVNLNMPQSPSLAIFRVNAC